MKRFKKFALRISLIYLMLFFSGTISAQITLNVKNQKIRQVIQQIEKAEGYSFFYNNELSELNNNVNIQVSNSSIENTLDKLFSNTNITYHIKDNKQIVLSDKSLTAQFSNTAQQDGNIKRLTGVIKDEAGLELPGVSILVKGTTNGTTTDLEGKFSINVPENATIEIRYVGFVTQTIRITNQTSVNIVLKEDTKVLDEVVILGFGMAARKADLSASIGTLENIDQLKNRPVSKAEDLLQGQIPGVTVSKNGGDPTVASSVVIRGKGSRSGESPLWVVDGVPGAPVNFNDIESMVVLKDAASAAIYGAYSGSAGVILVTTKQAVAGRPRISYEGTYSVSQATNLPQSLTIEQQREVRKQALAATGNSLPDGWDPVKNPYIAQTRTDWIDEIFRNSLSQRHSFVISGGTEDFANRLSLQYNDDQGVLLNTYNKNITMRYNAFFKISNKIKIREDFYWENLRSRGTNTDSGYTGVILSALMMPRNAEAYYSDGTFGGTAPKDPAYIAQYGSNFADIHGDVVNPLRTLESNNTYSRPTTISSSTFLDIDDIFIPGLKYTGRLTYRLTNYFYKNFNPMRPEPGKPNMTNRLDYETYRYYRWEVENTLNYSKSVGGHNIGAMLSTTANQQRRRDFNVSAQGFNNETTAFQYLNWGDSQKVFVGDAYTEPDNNVSVVGRASYSFNDRYFATASLRRDNAGRLPKDKKHGDFPAVTAAWKLTSEPYMPKSDIFNLIKLRASWGRIGNIGSVPFHYGDPTFVVESSNDVGGQVGSNTPLVPSMVYNGEAFNRYLTWETSEQLDFGIDLELLKNRLNLSIDFFNKTTKDLIKRQDTGWPSYIGPEPMYINQGEVKNRGWEFSAGWNDKVGDVNYYINANFATLKNWVSDIGPADPQTGKKPVWIEDDEFRGLNPFRTRENDPLYSFWVYKTDGLFQSDAEAEAYVNKDGKRMQAKAKAGDIKFVDTNGDGVINDDDREYVGSYTPKITYALTAGLTWKNLSASIMLQGVGGLKAFNAMKYVTLNESMVNFNRSADILKAWPNSNEVPRLTSSDDNGNFSNISDFYIEDASYMRIKNITVSYNFDKIFRSISPRLDERKSSLLVSASVDNIHTFTNYSGTNPEVGGKGLDGGKYPVPRVFSVGVKLTY